MICEKCAAAIPEGESVCPLCGWSPAEAADPADETAEAVGTPAEAPVEEVPEAAESAEAPARPAGRKKPVLWIAVAAAVIVAALVIALCIFGRRGAPSPVDRVLEMVDCLPDSEVDVALETVGLPKDTVLLTVNGADVTAEEYLYWLGNITSYYDMVSSYSGAPMDLTAEAADGVTWDEQLKLAARDNVVLLALVPGLAEEYGAELTDEDLQNIVEARSGGIEGAGGPEMYAYQLQAMGISDASALRINTITTLYNKFQFAWLEKTGAALPAEEVAAYIAEQDILRAKHILLQTRDAATGESLDDAAKAQALARAQDILAQLRAEPDKFDALMEENSQDPGLAAYPEGYLFTAGEMVSEFENATRALAFGEISDLIESDYGYHIILRLDPDCDEVRQSLAAERYDEAIQALVNAAEVKETDAYRSFTTAQYYEKLKAFQDSLPQPEVPDMVDQSYAELEPAP